MHPMYKERNREGVFQNLIMRHLTDNNSKFKEYLRVDKDLFELLLENVKDDLEPSRRRNNSISASEKLALTLRYLATGESYRSLAFAYRIHYSWISKAISKCLESIVKKFLHVVMPEPTEEQFKKISADFERLWNYPMCCGAIDGKHIRIVCPPKSGSLYFNYKGFFSVVLLAIVDAQYRFVAVDVGSYGREGDAGIFKKSKMGEKIIKNQFNLPQPATIAGTEIKVPHVILGDEAFSLQDNLMKSYPREQALNDREKAIYNCRHSRARRTTENAFGIMTSYFRIFHSPIPLNAEKVDNVILACCILHNMMRDAKIPAPQQRHLEDINTLTPTEHMVSLSKPGNSRSKDSAIEIRNKFKDYFCGPGRLGYPRN
ncbi:protein ALP1-like [Nilaparvata lugens]|uniref:protein ALP1-like n=1 Tax=Nilaparvata lugens TaxID=108931 RepID=UPI00193D3A06|nr:protein ALP1-like [Nilaparvata lugens]